MSRGSRLVGRRALYVTPGLYPPGREASGRATFREVGWFAFYGWICQSRDQTGKEQTQVLG